MSLLAIEAARGSGEHVPHGAIDLAIEEAAFALIEIPGPRRGARFADLCAGLVPLSAGRVMFLERDWAVMPTVQADALRGRIGRLFHQSFRADTLDVAGRVLLARLHHTRQSEAALREEAASLARRLGLPGLPAGPARLHAEPDLLRAACVRAFVGQPRLVILELPLAAQEDTLLAGLLALGAEARGRGAAVIWLAATGPAVRDRHVRPTQRLRLTDDGLAVVRRLGVAA